MRYLMIVLLAGCAQGRVWEKPGSSEQDFYMDRGACRAQAAAAPFGPGSTQAAMIFGGCMQGRGWYLVDQ